MIVMERSLELDVHSAPETGLRVERTDITFEDVSPGCVRISVRVHNQSDQRSSPTFMRLESAPLGAFVPWQPLAIVSVPPIEPGESRELSVDVERPRPAALGDFDNVPPSRLLTAVGSPDETPQFQRTVEALRQLLRQAQANRPATPNPPAKIGPLARDLSELVGRTQRYWAGNINVFIGAHPVERHLAKALRVYPGLLNMATFIVGGSGRPDAYAFDTMGLTPDWKSELYDVTAQRTFSVLSCGKPMQKKHWVEATGSLVVILATNPPACCVEGNVEVHVTRRSCGKTAIVEFNLDPTAQGPGCYAL